MSSPLFRIYTVKGLCSRPKKIPFIPLPDETVKERTALADDSSRPRFLLLTAAEFQTVVHFSFFVKYGLFLLDFSHAFLLGLVRLAEQSGNGLLPGVTDRRGDGSGLSNYLVGQPQARLDMLDDDCAVTVLDDGLTQHFKIFIFQYDLLVVLLHPQIKRADSQIGFFPVRISRIDSKVPWKLKSIWYLDNRHRSLLSLTPRYLPVVMCRMRIG